MVKDTKEYQQRRSREKSKLKWPPIADLENEIWVDIIGFEDYFQVSNFSRFKSLDRVVKCGPKELLIRSRILKPYKGSDGYLKLDLVKGNFRKCVLAHRAIAEAFIPNLENKPTVNHKDLNKSNMKIENLEWATRIEQSIHFWNEKEKSSKYTGVSFYKKTGKWMASIHINGAKKYLGCYETEELANFAIINYCPQYKDNKYAT
jgi:hypothetical protein